MELTTRDKKVYEDYIVGKYLFRGIKKKLNKDLNVFEPTEREKQHINTLLSKLNEFSTERLMKYLKSVNYDGKKYFEIPTDINFEPSLHYADYMVGDFIFQNVEHQKDLFTDKISLSDVSHSRIVKIYSLLAEAPADALYQIAPTKNISGKEYFLIREEFDIYIDALTVLKYFEPYEDYYFNKMKGLINIPVEIDNINSSTNIISSKINARLDNKTKNSIEKYKTEQEHKSSAKISLDLQEEIEKKESNNDPDDIELLPKRDVEDLIDLKLFQKQREITSTSISTSHNPRGKSIILKSITSNKLKTLGTNIPNRIDRKVISTERNQSLSQTLKSLYKHQCQVCGEKVQIGLNEYSSESHHIQPVGGNHQGPDIASNIIILCPNHHLMFDRGAITIELKTNKVIHVDATNSIHDSNLILKHEIEERHVDYHNKHIFKGVKPPEKFNKLCKKQNQNFNKVIILLDSDGDENEILLENESNKHLMTDIEKLLIFASVGDIIDYNGFSYLVKAIK
ncbi:HNH endonuclease [Neobacillus sp. 179-C4.2 HS]|uniref:HNH endonuclease n=1 Tax=Neobacillus driksii TaxID=3035913 RepID=A0ABV4YUD7_9BACI|nr:HNH endonuclease [Neobacillus sp. 179.-C4.2 HS]MDP5192768.1 HNH endonuclease [Neobacillus sp. 179.-C4.2 HS]